MDENFSLVLKIYESDQDLMEVVMIACMYFTIFFWDSCIVLYNCCIIHVPSYRGPFVTHHSEDYAFGLHSFIRLGQGLGTHDNQTKVCLNQKEGVGQGQKLLFSFSCVQKT